MSSIGQLEEAVEAVELSLSNSDLSYLEEPYEPKPITGSLGNGESAKGESKGQ